MQIGNYKVMGDGRLVVATAKVPIKLPKAVCNNPLSALRFCPCLCWTDSELSTRRLKSDLWIRGEARANSTKLQAPVGPAMLVADKKFYASAWGVSADCRFNSDPTLQFYNMNKYNQWRKFYSIRDTPGWQKKYPVGPVHFDLKCDIHNVEYLDLSPEQLPSGPNDFIKLFTCCFGDKSHE